jgi:hypothetical protein
MTKPRNKMLEPPKNLLRPVVSDIHRRLFVFVDIYRSKSECIIKLINVRSFTKAFGICRHSPANVDIHYFWTLTVTYTFPKKLRIFLFVNEKGRTGIIIDTHVEFHLFSAKFNGVEVRRSCR